MTDPATDISQRTRETFAKFNSGDIAGVLERMDPEIDIFAPPELPNSGSFRGHAGFQQWLAAWLEAWDEFTIEVESTTAIDDEHVLTTVVQHAVGKGSGVPVSQRLFYLGRWRGDMLVAFHLYSTEEDARRAAAETS